MSTTRLSWAYRESPIWSGFIFSDIPLATDSSLLQRTEWLLRVIKPDLAQSLLTPGEVLKWSAAADEEFPMTTEITVREPRRGYGEVFEVPVSIGPPEPVFLIGSRCSGSTLFRLMLGSHPDVACRRHAEVEDAFRLMKPGAGLPSDLSSYFAAIEGDYECSLSDLSVDRSLPLDQFLKQFWDQVAREDNAHLHMGTVHSNFSFIPKIWPEARYVYLYRDGRDVARSRVNLDWEGSYWSAIEKWIESEDEWQSMKSGLDSKSYLEVRYENLVLEMDSTLREVCSFLGVDFTNRVLNYTQTGSYTDLGPALVNQWKIDATEMDIRTAEARAGKHLKARSYPLSGLPVVRVDPGQARRLERKGIWKRRYRRARSRGFGNSFLQLLSRRLGLTRLHANVALTIDKRRQSRLD